MSEAVSLFEERSILDLKMDLEIARHFFDCSSQDNRFRLMLYRRAAKPDIERYGSYIQMPMMLTESAGQ